jgi:hypothetical protein
MIVRSTAQRTSRRSPGTGPESSCPRRSLRAGRRGGARPLGRLLLVAAALLLGFGTSRAQYDRPSEHYPVDLVRSEPSMVTIVAGLGTTLVRQFNMVVAGRRYWELRPDAINFFFYRSLFETAPDDPLTCGLEFNAYAGMPRPKQFNAFSLGLQLRSLGYGVEGFRISSVASVNLEQANVVLTRIPGSSGDDAQSTLESSWLDLRCDLGLAFNIGIITREARMRVDPFTERLERQGFLLEGRVGYAFSPYFTDWNHAEALGYSRPEALTPAFYATIRIGSRFTVQQ